MGSGFQAVGEVALVIYNSWMFILDCESLSTALKSFEAAIGISRDQFQKAYTGLNLDDLAKGKPDMENDMADLLLSEVTDKRAKDVLFDQVVWFHGTRLFNDQSPFQHGLHPLGEAIDEIWDQLGKIAFRHHVSTEEWNRFRDDVGDSQSANLYKSKISNKALHGPYGVLLCDALLVPGQFGIWPYLQKPEIIDDICICVNEKLGVSLSEDYMNSTCPAVVKFTDNHLNVSTLDAALIYIYASISGWPMNGCTTNYDATGSAIDASRIISVKYIQYK